VFFGELGALIVAPAEPITRICPQMSQMNTDEENICVHLSGGPAADSEARDPDQFRNFLTGLTRFTRLTINNIL
jgi:hypothetical protein